MTAHRVARGVRWAPLVAVSAAAVVGALLPSSAAALTLRGNVSEVVDGDTIKVTVRGFETSVRLLGVNAPETRHPTKPVQCFGPAASKRLSRLLPMGQRVRLVTDPTQDTRDRYARLLAYVYKPGRSGPTGSVNFGLVSTGHAKVYVYDGLFRHARPFFRGQQLAKDLDRGLWAPPCLGNITKPEPGTATVGDPEAVPEPTPPTAPTPTSPGPATPTPPPGGCDPNYAGACIPNVAYDLDCGEITARNFQVVGSDRHNFDVDRDGIACEQ